MIINFSIFCSTFHNIFDIIREIAQKSDLLLLKQGLQFGNSHRAVKIVALKHITARIDHYVFVLFGFNSLAQCLKSQIVCGIYNIFKYHKSRLIGCALGYCLVDLNDVDIKIRKIAEACVSLAEIVKEDHNSLLFQELEIIYHRRFFIVVDIFILKDLNGYAGIIDAVFIHDVYDISCKVRVAKGITREIDRINVFGSLFFVACDPFAIFFENIIVEFFVQTDVVYRGKEESRSYNALGLGIEP